MPVEIMVKTLHDSWFAAQLPMECWQGCGRYALLGSDYCGKQRCLETQ